MKSRVAIFACLLAVASPALAQRELYASNANPFTPPPGAFFKPTDRDGAEARMRQFTQCVVRGDPTLGAKLLQSTPNSAEETALYRKVAESRNRCLGSGRLTMKNRSMRGALAEQMYLHDYPDPIAEPAKPAATFVASHDGIQAYHSYGNCVVSRDPTAVDAVIRAKPRTAKEKQAYQNAAPALSTCLSGEGQSLRIDRLALRGFLAEALYRYRKG